jgi:adenylosuccinate lyase
MKEKYDEYFSPFSWRYGSEEMRKIWGEKNKRTLWREIWTALAEVQAEFGLVSVEQAADLHAHKNEVDLQRALEIEGQIHHDLMAELRVFAEQSPLGGKVLHLGATSADIQDNTDALRMRASMGLVLEKLGELLLVLAEKIDTWGDTPIIAFTHLQPAEPSTLGYRLAIYAQDLLLDYETIKTTCTMIKGKGFKGAVGSGASFSVLIGKERFSEFEERISSRLDLPFYSVTTQTYPRKQDYQVLCGLSGLGASLHKFALDIRILQSPVIGELSEPFGSKQVGSSAMPFKRNPINAEKINSLARLLAQKPRTAWDNAAHSSLERTLDDSANRRVILPESFLIVDELLESSLKITNGLQVDETAIERNLSTYGQFAGVEPVLMALVKSGADRQTMHECLRGHSMEAWSDVIETGTNTLEERLYNDPKILEFISKDKLADLMDIRAYIGDAPERAKKLADEIRTSILG